MIAAIYFSPTDTSRKGAEAIAKALGDGEFLSIDVTRFDAEPERTEFGPEDAVVFGAPVYGGRLYRGCRERFRRFRGNGTPCIVTVTYGNRDYDDALLELTDLLEAQGFRVVGAGAFIARHSIFPTVAADRPDEKDMAAIAAFGRECQARRGLFSDSHPGEILVKGSRPYKKPCSASFRPAGDKSCTACGACAAICPTHSIDPADPTVTSGDACIACAACIRVCPAGSRAFRGAAYHAARKAFELKCAPYRLPETFYRA